MKRLIVSLVLIVLISAIVACQKQHPIRVFADPGLEKSATKIAVFPFLTSLLESDDPTQEAPETMEKHFKPALDARNDYTFISSATLKFAVEGTAMDADYRTFCREYPRTQKADAAFFDKLSKTLNADAFLIPVVDMWQKDEVDYQENATPATYVGATITVVDMTGQKILFQATDEDYSEGARSEAGDRGVVSSAGRVRMDSGAKTHRAPPYEEVAIRVIHALVESLPVR